MSSVGEALFIVAMVVNVWGAMISYRLWQIAEAIRNRP